MARQTKITDKRIVDMLANSEILSDTLKTEELAKRLPNLKPVDIFSRRQLLVPSQKINFSGKYHSILRYWQSRASYGATPANLANILEKEMGLKKVADEIRNNIVPHWSSEKDDWFLETPRILAADAILTAGKTWEKLMRELSISDDIPNVRQVGTTSFTAFWHDILQQYESVNGLHEDLLGGLMRALQAMNLMGEYNFVYGLWAEENEEGMEQEEYAPGQLC